MDIFKYLLRIEDSHSVWKKLITLQLQSIQSCYKNNDAHEYYLIILFEILFHTYI